MIDRGRADRQILRRAVRAMMCNTGTDEQTEQLAQFGRDKVQRLQVYQAMGSERRRVESIHRQRIKWTAIKRLATGASEGTSG